MIWTREELKDNANILLKDKHGKSAKVILLSVLPGFILGLVYSIALTGFIIYMTATKDGVDIGTMAFMYFVAIFALYPLIFIVTIFLTNILHVGVIRFFLNFRNGNENTEDIWFGFRNGNYGNIFKVCFLRTLFTFLWGMLLYVPGVIKYFEYSMIPFLLAENPQMSAKEAFVRSKQMMNGQKADAFVLDLTFIGWFILSSYTYHILYLFYLGPYFNLTWCELYYKLSGRQMPRLYKQAPVPVYPAYPPQGYGMPQGQPLQQGYGMPQGQPLQQGYGMPQGQPPMQGYGVPAQPPHPTAAEQSAASANAGAPANAEEGISASAYAEAEIPIYDPGNTI